ncbi:MAG: PTS sugar transporter subunit IIA [Xanthomonadales bacterium]|nr:PTS sugar transporter subunit IIA [Xanthomonadales bacterium]
MQVSDLLSPERISLNEHAGSKKKLLEILSDLLVNKEDSNDVRLVFESLCSRERLGSTSIGNGVAIPHGRVPDSNTARAAFVRLRKAIQFEAEDGEPVDMLFAITVPQHCSEDHLQLLSQVEDMFSNAEFREQLRTADSAAKLQELLANWKS